MRTFSDLYRNHLRAYLEALLQRGGMGTGGESSLAAACADLPALDVP